MRMLAWMAAAWLSVGAAVAGQAVRLQVAKPGLVVKRGVSLEPAENDSEATRKIKQVLKTKKVSFEFVDTSFADALNFIQALLGVNIVIDPKVKTEQALTLTVRDMNVGAALQWVLRLGGAALEIRDGAVYVKPDPARRQTVVQRPQALRQAYRHRRMLGKAQIHVGDVVTVELYLYEDELPPETRQMLLNVLKAALKAQLDKLAAPPLQPGK